MNYEKLFGDNLKGADGLGAHRDGFIAMNPFQNFQSVSKFPPQYQFPSSSIGSNPFTVHDGLALNNNHGFGYKFANEPTFGHSALETQNQYGPPMMQSKGKLKGAALSALTLLAFLFFLNLLQSCLKDQMDTMNPTVMVMSAGQRTYLMERNDAQNDELRKVERLDKLTSDEQVIQEDKSQREYGSDEYGSYYQMPEKEESTPKPARKQTKTKHKRIKNKPRFTEVSIIEPELKNKINFRSNN